MIRGETVYVATVATGGKDRFNDRPRAWNDPVAVDGVLVVPSTADEGGLLRPDGVRVTHTLHFPRGFTLDLRGARVTVRGVGGYVVVGDPAPYTEDNVPGPWTMPVVVGRSDG